MTTLKLDRNLTDVNPQHVKTYAGQAHFADSGPAGQTCAGCEHWLWHAGDHDRFGWPKASACSEFMRLMRNSERHSPKVPFNAGACRYFKPRDVPVVRRG